MEELNTAESVETKEFVFEKINGGGIHIRGLHKIYRTTILCNTNTLKIIQTKGKSKINENTAKEIVVNTSQVVSVNATRKVQILPLIWLLLSLVATFTLGLYYIILAILAVIALTNKNLVIRLSDGRKINLPPMESPKTEIFTKEEAVDMLGLLGNESLMH